MICVEPVGVVAARTAIGSRLVREYPARRNRQVTREVVFLGNEARAGRRIVTVAGIGLPSIGIFSIVPVGAVLAQRYTGEAERRLHLPPVTGSFGRDLACELA